MNDNRPSPDPAQPLTDADTAGHLAEDSGLTDEQFTAETGLDDPVDPAGKAASAVPPD
jgi:hypothetical protein